MKKYKLYFKSISILISLLTASIIFLNSCERDDEKINNKIQNVLCSKIWTLSDTNFQPMILKFTKDGKSYDLINPSIVNKYEINDSTIWVHTSDRKIQIKIIELSDTNLIIKFEGNDNNIQFKPTKPFELIYGKWKVISSPSSFIIEFQPNGNGIIEMISDTSRIKENILYKIRSDSIYLIDKNKQIRGLKYALQDEFNLELLDNENVRLQLQRI